MTIRDAFIGPDKSIGKNFSGPCIYGGVQSNIYVIDQGHFPPPITFLFILDVPLSICLDTVILPISLTNESLIAGDNDDKTHDSK
jgi:uncharacterized protein YceK